MEKLIEALKGIEVSLAKTRGPFNLFGLFLRMQDLDRWDLVASSAWLKENHREDIGLISQSLQDKLSPDQLLMISGIVILNPQEPFVKMINGIINCEHGFVDFENNTINGITIAHAYLITSQNLSAE